MCKQIIPYLQHFCKYAIVRHIPTYVQHGLALHDIHPQLFVLVLWCIFVRIRIHSLAYMFVVVLYHSAHPNNYAPWPLLHRLTLITTWISHYLHHKVSGAFTYHPKLQRCNRWCLGMDIKIHPTLYWACEYLFTMGVKPIHVSKRGPRPS